MRRHLLIAASSLAAALGIAAIASDEHGKPVERQWVTAPVAPALQTREQAQAKSAGCMDCHRETDQPSMHASPAVVLGCADCHGGDAGVRWSGPAVDTSAEYVKARDSAHVLPRFPDDWHWPASANPVRSYTLLNREAPEFIRFVNPSDYRVVREACGACHLKTILAAERSLMSTNAMFWGGAAYNNGLLPFKNYILGEAYTRDGRAAILEGAPASTEDRAAHGILEKLYPLPPWQNLEPADVFRVFEDGGRNLGNLFPETGLPNAAGNIQRLEEPGRPDIRQSNRGRGTGARIAVPVLNIHKTRLNDPLAWFLGTNDQPGDYRSSGCSACHVVYANDRDPKHSGPYARFGHGGSTQSRDPTIPRERPGHPLAHAFSRAIPTSQCMVCHMHQPNMFMNTYLGYTMWDYEADAPFMWPKEQKYPTAAEARAVYDRNPEGAAARGLWGDPEFLKRVSELNPQLEDTQFADYHGHGWNFRAIFKRDRRGNLLDAEGRVVANDDPKKFERAVHLSSAHADAGMHCVDCHFAQDAHGNGHLYGEVAQAVEIDCKDCHGTVNAYPTLRTSGPAAGPSGSDLSVLRNPDGRRRFEWLGGKLVQRSALDPQREWDVSLVKDSVTPAHPHYNEKAARAKLMSRDTRTLAWGARVAPDDLAHADEEMECYACHTSWTTACGGCHLPIEANWKTESHRYEGGTFRNWSSYNPQVARDEVFMLGLRGPTEGGKVAPVRSSSALVLSSTNANRERIYVQQPPIAASGYSSQAMNPHYPHTERKTETKRCNDCHLSAAGDNNAIMAQTLGLGTQFINLLGFHAWVGTDGEVAAVQVTEWDEPQAVIGSYLHRYAYPDWFRRHGERGLELQHASTHASGPARCLQLRGEYLYVAEGERGLVVYDAASIGNKGVSQKLVTAPFSPLGHDTRVKTRDARCVALPTTQPVHPARNEGELMRVANLEQPFVPIYNYAAVADAVEGLILVDVNTLADGEFRNNRLKRALTWDGGGVLRGARHLTIGGSYAYVIADAGLVVVDLSDPLAPKAAAPVPLRDGRASALQFRYLFVTDATGLKVVDVTQPMQPKVLSGAAVPLASAAGVFVARTYAYVADGAKGLAIVDIEKPAQPRLFRHFDADGAIQDARDVVVASTNATLFAYVADGATGLKVVQLTAPDTQPNFYGFSPEPRPQLVARYATRRAALALSRPLERDRAVDETGGQVAVFGRRGARPFNGAEMRRLYLDRDGAPWVVPDEW
ncbi:MAG TPA: hypothetical protein VD701_02980 [Steroidobacteraceae bacterium]|nr:hypothetical protein [Steroidobacteraceae bacterium]